MGIVLVTAVQLQRGGVLTAPALTAFAGGDRVVLKAPAGHSLEPERTFFVVTNTDTAGHTLRLTTGDPVLGAGQQRQQTYFIAAGERRYLGPIDSSKVTQSDGSISFEFEAGHAGSFEAYTMPRGA